MTRVFSLPNIHKNSKFSKIGLKETNFGASRKKLNKLKLHLDANSSYFSRNRESVQVDNQPLIAMTSRNFDDMQSPSEISNSAFQENINLQNSYDKLNHLKSIRSQNLSDMVSAKERLSTVKKHLKTISSKLSKVV